LFALIARQFRDGNAGEFGTEADGVLARQWLHQRKLALLAVEHFENLVRFERLMPEDVSFVIGLFLERAVWIVTVEDRTAERHMLGRIAVAAHRHVPASHHKLALAL